MKKIITVVLAALTCLVFPVGCGAKDNDDRISVVATIFAPYDFTRQIAGEKLKVKMLLPPASESHSYEPSPQDIIAIQKCRVFIYVGGESDVWVDGILESMDTSKMTIVKLIDCVEPVEEEIKEGMQDDEHEHDEEDEDGDEHDEEEEGEEHEHEYDEHVWTSPANAKLIVAKITDALCGVDGGNAETYKANAAAYGAKLDGLDQKFREIVDAGKRKTIIVGDRYPFRYFTDAYGLDYFAAFPGCATETEASAATIAGLIDKVKNNNIPVVFKRELSTGNIAATIAEGAGANVKVLELHSCHNVTLADFNAGKTYLDIMNANAEVLKEALS
ncbi:MAG: metal ABC transporter substrate-binding protein [Clostridiales bacterium]|jgi:zinc transport system substrate-binding protein|nr:metal ABC transporter substrate-binding protein [Clostridiales bacterium]